MALALLCSLTMIFNENRFNIGFFLVIGAEGLIGLPDMADLELNQQIFLTNSAILNRLVRNAGRVSRKQRRTDS